MKNIKYYLIDIFNEYKSKYPELKIWLSDNAVSQSWGMGVLPAYSLEPYNCELLGYKPGRMLKIRTALQQSIDIDILWILIIILSERYATLNSQISKKNGLYTGIFTLDKTMR